MRLTLRQKLNGAIIITFLIIAILFIAVQVPFQQHRLQQNRGNIEVLLTTLVERDAEQLANEIFDERSTAMQIRIEQMRQVESILGITVFDRKGQKLVSDGTALTHKDVSAAERQQLENQHLLIKKQWQGGGALLFTEKIAFLGETLGYIRIHYSLKQMEDSYRLSLFISFGLLVTILLVMLIVLNLILSKAILNPITYLRDATKYIVQGDLERSIDMHSKDELGHLAESFERMRDAIKEKISDLKRMSSIIESTSDLVSVATIQGKIIYMNKAGRRLIGWPDSDDLEDKAISEFHPDWACEKLKNTGIPQAVEHGTWVGETALIAHDGSTMPVSQVVISHRDAEDNTVFISTIIRDISASKKAESELRYLRNYLANIIDSMPSILIGVDNNTHVTQWNDEACKATGLLPDQAMGLPLVQAFPRLSNDITRVRDAIHNRQMISEPKRAYQKGDETRFEDMLVFPLISEGMEGAVIRLDDVTEKVRMEAMVIQSEKMLSIGGLAAGMAHEINNPLAGMMQTASVLIGRLTNPKLKANQKAATDAGIRMEDIQNYTDARDIPKMLDNIMQSGIRASKIVNNMLSFARKSDDQSATHNLAELMDQTIELASSDYNLKKRFDFRQIAILREYQDNVPDVPCDSGQIQQVLLNILRNGAEAMQGELSESKKIHKKHQFILRLCHESDAEMVRLEIEDNGPGMDESTRKRVLDPFFTTKPTGSGTGLGLSVSYFIIAENHGGTMSVDTKPGQGSTFIIRLPLKSQKQA